MKTKSALLQNANNISLYTDWKFQYDKLNRQLDLELDKLNSLSPIERDNDEQIKLKINDLKEQIRKHKVGQPQRPDYRIMVQKHSKETRQLAVQMYQTEKVLNKKIAEIKKLISTLITDSGIIEEFNSASKNLGVRDGNQNLDIKMPRSKAQYEEILKSIEQF